MNNDGLSVTKKTIVWLQKIWNIVIHIFKDYLLSLYSILYLFFKLESSSPNLLPLNNTTIFLFLFLLLIFFLHRKMWVDKSQKQGNNKSNNNKAIMAKASLKV